jgi:mono/diheme cytochrome c family protein
MEIAMHRLLISIATLLLIASAEASVAEDMGVGKQLYVDNCAICHGNEAQGLDAKGKATVGKKLAGDAAYWDFPIFKRAVVEGLDDQGKQMKTMPVFGKTGLFKPKGQIPADTDLQNIQAYLKTLAPAQ